MNNFFVSMRKLLRQYSLKCQNKKKLMFCINMGLLLSIFALLFIHLGGTNEAATEGFILKKLYLELSELKATNKDLTLESAEMQSIPRIKEAAINEFDMVKSESSERNYIVLSKTTDIVKK